VEENGFYISSDNTPSLPGTAEASIAEVAMHMNFMQTGMKISPSKFPSRQRRAVIWQNEFPAG
jgi:hypothetical protein